MNKNKKVAIAMSGGIDSSVAAALLKKQGYDCIGIFMKFWEDKSVLKKVENRCCSADSYQKARRVAHHLGFKLYTLNFKNDFKKQIVDDFLKQYKTGNTPNPCIRCNQFIKFNLLLKKAKVLGCDYFATGHYVINKNLNLYRARDKNKDQSYFLYTLNQKQLKQILFPLGQYRKDQVKKLAKEYELPVQWRTESQEVCFVPDKKLEDFLLRHLKLKSGDIVTIKDQKVGKHKGLALYTIGQRKGIKIGGIGPFYVIKKDYKSNNLIVSKNKDDNLLYKKEFRIKGINWINVKPSVGKKYDLQVRYQAKPTKCKIEKNKVIITKPVKAVTAGQSAVIYEKNKLIGGGVIS